MNILNTIIKQAHKSQIYLNFLTHSLKLFQLLVNYRMESEEINDAKFDIAFLPLK